MVDMVRVVAIMLLKNAKKEIEKRGSFEATRRILRILGLFLPS